MHLSPSFLRGSVDYGHLSLILHQEYVEYDA